MNTSDPLELWAHRLLRMSEELAVSTRCPYDLGATDKGFEEFLKILFDMESEHRAESDASVHAFIETGAWPEQSAWAKYITFLRVNCAAEYACQLTAHDESEVVLSIPHERSDDSVLVLFLIDHWQRCFDVWLKLTAISLFFSIPFYGLKPAVD